MSSYESTTAFLQAQASAAMNAANNNAGRIYSLPPSPSLRNPRLSADLSRPGIGPPPKLSDLFDGDKTDPTLVYMNDQADKWVSKYCPEINACLKNLPEEFLCGVISGVRPFGHSKTYFELVWHEARDRAARTCATEVANLGARFSASGFQLPPGAYVDAVAGAEQRASEAVLAVNVQQAIKDADIKLELLKFAEEQALQYKLGVLRSLADFYRTWVSVSDADIRRASVRAQAQSALYAALSSYYNVELSYQELVLRAAQAKAEVDVSVDRNAVARQGNFGATASALGSAVGAFAQIAAGANQAGGSLTAEIEVGG